MLETALAAPLNHLLRGAPWALSRLAPFAGKTAEIHVFPLSLRLTVQPDGLVCSADPDAAPAVVMRLSAPLLARVLGGDEAAYNQVDIEGDTGFGREIAYLARHLEWDAEEDLSRLFGDIAAHRMVGTARELNEWRRQATDKLLENLKEYWTEEQPLIAKPGAVAEFNRAVDELRADVDRLEKRLERLERGI